MADRARRFICWLVPASAATVVGILLIFVGAWTWPTLAIPDNIRHIVRHELVNWSLAEPTLSRLLADQFSAPPGKVTLVTSNYKLGAELEYMYRPSHGVFVLDNLSNVVNGIAPQHSIWNLNESSLRRTRPGAEVLIVIDNRDHQLTSLRKMAFRKNLCSVFSALRFLGDFEYSPGRRRLHFYKGRVNPPGTVSPPEPQPENCAALPSLHLSHPRFSNNVRGIVPIYGWALDNNAGIKRVEILVDGRKVALARYGWHYPRIKKFMPGSTDPIFPSVGLGYRWDSTTVSNGLHRLSIRAHSADGKIQEFGRRAVFVDNP